MKKRLWLIFFITVPMNIILRPSTWQFKFNQEAVTIVERIACRNELPGDCDFSITNKTCQGYTMRRNFLLPLMWHLFQMVQLCLIYVFQMQKVLHQNVYCLRGESVRGMHHYLSLEFFACVIFVKMRKYIGSYYPMYALCIVLVLKETMCRIRGYHLM